MKKNAVFALAAMLALPGLTLVAQEKKKPNPTIQKTSSTDKSSRVVTADGKEKPGATPGLIVIEDFWFPLRFEPLETLDNARYHYRRNEEKSAAKEIDKAVSWLNLAATHAMPETKKHLDEAITELKSVSRDLESGSVFAADRFDASLRKAAHALANWHYYRAKESWGKTEAQDAGQNLVMAANYLQNAANSAHFQYGSDSQEVLTEVFRNGKLVTDETHTEYNWVAKDLEGVETALRELGATLKK